MDLTSLCGTRDTPSIRDATPFTGPREQRGGHAKDRNTPVVSIGRRDNVLCIGKNRTSPTPSGGGVFQVHNLHHGCTRYDTVELETIH
jgi:hypothetical protein